MERVETVAFAGVAAVLLVLPFGAAARAAESTSCTRSCSNISIPYPFGVESGCYHAGGGFNLTCDRSYRPPKLFLGDGTVQVLDISLLNGTVRINSSRMEFAGDDDGGSSRTVNMTWGSSLPQGGPYFLSESVNSIAVLGCDVQADLRGKGHDSLIGSCIAICPSDGRIASEDPCSGIGCCQIDIVLGYSMYNIQIHHLHGSFSSYNTGSIYMVYELYDYREYKLNNYYSGNYFPEALPASLGWVISNLTCPTEGSAPECRSAHSSCRNYSTSPDHPGYLCECVDGRQGNPYVVGGCQVTGLCEHHNGLPCYGTCVNLSGNFYCQCPGGTYGDPFTKEGCITIKKSFTELSIGLGFGGGICLLILALFGPFIIRKIKLQKLRKTKEKFFNQNHGLLLQQLVSRKTDIGERMIITLAELEKATNNFDTDRVIGGGGHGVVFKGILDLHVVAIKKSKIVVQREIDEFINEVAVLSQVNHRNVVKLLGCCLEAEVPLLIYEFISNGTLYQHLHIEERVPLPWDDRLRIAMEVARALSYLHSAASMPIFHRDVKSSNILLDESLTAKVSDFGASRYIPIDKTGVTTAVQGTIGYLDPMYYYTGRLTDKSDVFSFGVLLVELLTRKKPFVYRTDDGNGLVSHFVSLLAEGRLVDIIDPQIIEEEHAEVQEVSRLAAICTKLKGEDRPTMREVEITLENLIVKKKHVPCTTPSRRYNELNNLAHYMPAERVNEEASRQHTMEEEILMSANYPR